MQFNRYIEIVIRNFDTKEEVSIKSTDGFRIDFDYNEYLDQSSSSNTGTIKIYNLSIQTFQKIGTRFRTEVEIWCGYKNQFLNTVGRLCIGGLTSKSRERNGADHITTMEFQTAIRELQASNKIAYSAAPKTTLIDAIGAISEIGGFDTSTFKITVEDQQKYGKDIVDKVSKINFPHGVTFQGTPRQVFNKISEMFGIGYTINPQTPNLVEWYLKESGFTKLSSIKESLHVGNDVKSEIQIVDESGTAQLLTMESGLIGTPYVETIETSTAYGDALDENEELIYAKPVVAKRNKKGEVMKDKNGKVKKTKTPKKKTISRVVVNAKALINPAIKPNSWIKLENTYNQVDGFYRVRNIKYTASTHENDGFIMEMTLAHMK